MKCTNWHAFEHWLMALTRATLPRVIFVQAGDDFERNEAILRLIAHYRGLLGNEIELKKASLSTLANELVDDLFGTIPSIVWIDEADDLQEEELETIRVYGMKGGTGSQKSLFFSLSSLPKCLQKYTHGVIVEIATVKPWERQGRVQEWLSSYVVQNGKRIQPQAAARLAKDFAEDRFTLKSELDKLFAYVGAGPEITLLDCAQICSVAETSSLWDLIPAIFERNLSLSMGIIQNMHGGDMHTLQIARYIRNQIHQALIMVHLAADGKSAGESMQYFPQLRHQKAFEKQFALAVRYGRAALEKALIAVDYLEVGLKDEVQDEELALEILVLKLTQAH